MGTEEAIVFTTGHQANIGTLGTLLAPGDTVVADSGDHASILDGCLLSRAKLRAFRHNRLDLLAKQLGRATEDGGGVLVVVDGVFSMEGDIAPLPGLIEVAKKHGARIFVDEAHSLGVIGPTGAGAVDHYGVQKDVDLVMGTFSKSFASIGGFVAAEAEIIHYLKHHARPLIFSAAMPAYAVATVLAALDVIRTEPERRQQLLVNADYLRNGLKALGYDTATSETPIIPIVIGDATKTFRFWRALFDGGVFANCVVAPAVPPNSCRIRTSLIATHTRPQLDRVLDTFAKVGKEFGVI
jgi:8-amino-7-oxononanoate synthase